MLTLRRLALLVAAALCLAPLASRAEPPADYTHDAKHVRVDVAASAGRYAFGSCGNIYSVRYGGFGGSARVKFAGPVVARAAAGASYVRSEKVSDSEDGTDSESVGTDFSEYAIGGLAQGGLEFRYFGALVGLGLTSVPKIDSAATDLLPLIPCTVRIGPVVPFHVRFHLMDQLPIEQGVAGAELVFANGQMGMLAAGVDIAVRDNSTRLKLASEAIISHALRLGLVGRLGTEKSDAVGQAWHGAATLAYVFQ